MQNKYIKSTLIIFMLCTSCYGQREIPVDIYLSPLWDNEEAKAIILGMESWEKATQLNFFNFRERSEDIKFTFTDLTDNVNTVYRIQEKNNIIEQIENETDIPEGHSLTGYGFHTDILILECNFPDHLFEEENRERYRIFLYNLAQHETGHFLGLGHNELETCETSVMKQGCVTSLEVREITEIDIEQVRLFYP